MKRLFILGLMAGFSLTVMAQEGANNPTGSGESYIKNYDQRACVDTVASYCIQHQCAATSDIDCENNCFNDSRIKCAMNMGR